MDCICESEIKNIVNGIIGRSYYDVFFSMKFPAPHTNSLRLEKRFHWTLKIKNFPTAFKNPQYKWKFRISKHLHQQSPSIKDDLEDIKKILNIFKIHEASSS